VLGGDTSFFASASMRRGNSMVCRAAFGLALMQVRGHVIGGDVGDMAQYTSVCSIRERVRADRKDVRRATELRTCATAPAREEATAASRRTPAMTRGRIAQDGLATDQATRATLPVPPR